MTMTIDAETVAEGIFDLFRTHPWLQEPGVMRPDDAPFEPEAIRFLLKFVSAPEQTERWEETSPAAQRIVCSLLLDFMAKLMKGPMANGEWQVPAAPPLWRKALDVIDFEIRRTYPQNAPLH